MEVSNWLVSWFINYLQVLQPTYIGVIIHLLGTMDIPVLNMKQWCRAKPQLQFPVKLFPEASWPTCHIIFRKWKLQQPVNDMGVSKNRGTGVPKMDGL